MIRLTDLDLDNIEALAKGPTRHFAGPFAHPLDTLKLVAEVRALRIALNAAPAMVFADGREPTTNERHLANLLSWRISENEQWQAEAKRLQGIINGLVDQVAAQSDLLTRRAEGQG